MAPSTHQRQEDSPGLGDLLTVLSLLPRRWTGGGVARSLATANPYSPPTMKMSSHSGTSASGLLLLLPLTHCIPGTTILSGPVLHAPFLFPSVQEPEREALCCRRS